MTKLVMKKIISRDLGEAGSGLALKMKQTFHFFPFLLSNSLHFMSNMILATGMFVP